MQAFFNASQLSCLDLFAVTVISVCVCACLCVCVGGGWGGMSARLFPNVSVELSGPFFYNCNFSTGL